ncbi:lipopolysaccharide biosynthesis protein, partial [Stackebrandtia soli]|uniref:lipopolysaccharide biosynthesis protein n=1 Tax=Stackebrandtia soli TaxID=1892856 RepID=UPI0039E75190
MADLTVERSANILRRTARGGALNLGGAAFSGAGGVVVTWLVAAGLGPHAAGQFFAATSAFLLALALARLGTPTGLVYWVALTKRSGRPGALGEVLRVALVPAMIAASVAAFALWVAAPTLGDWQDEGGDAYASALRVLAVFLPCAVAVEALLAATRGLGRMRPSVTVDKIGRTIAQLATLALVLAIPHSGVLAVTWAWTWPFLPAALAALWSWRRLCADLPPVKTP